MQNIVDDLSRSQKIGTIFLSLGFCLEVLFSFSSLFKGLDFILTSMMLFLTILTIGITIGLIYIEKKAYLNKVFIGSLYLVLCTLIYYFINKVISQ